MRCLVVSLLSLCFFSSCTNLFLQPDRTLYPQLEQSHLDTEEVEIFSSDHVRLCAWDFRVKENQVARPDAVTVPSDHPIGLVLQVHGNALNMSNHFQSVAWLPFASYEVFTFDFRGYGASEGSPDVGGSIEDTKAAIRFMDKEAARRGLKWALVGQSLGGSLALRALEEQKTENLKLVLIEASFYSYKSVAQEKMASTWVTWPFQWLAKIFVSDQYSPGGPELARIVPGVPVILMYSTKDPVMPYHQGQMLYADLREPKEFWSHDLEGHINGFATPDRAFRKKFLSLLNKNLTIEAPKLDSKSDDASP